MLLQAEKTLSSWICIIAEALDSYDNSIAVRQRVALDLLCAATQKNKEALILEGVCTLSDKEQELLKEMIDRLINKNEPLQYILGSVQFLDLELIVRPPVLIPRVETEFWVDALLRELPVNDSLNILDMCAGSGCIGLALAHYLSEAHIVSVDIEEACAHLTQENAFKNKLESRVTVLQGNLFDALTNQKFDLIVSNPPYIPTGARSEMQNAVIGWEDEKALFSGENGLICIDQILSQAFLFLKGSRVHPALVLEIDRTQGNAITELAKKYNYSKVEIRKDQFGNDRIAYLWI
jgi:release factor glutamine methyltransferase